MVLEPSVSMNHSRRGSSNSSSSNTSSSSSSSSISNSNSSSSHNNSNGSKMKKKNKLNSKSSKPTTPTHGPNVVLPLMMDKLLSVLSLTAKTSSKIIGPSAFSLASTLLRYYHETLLTPTSKHRLNDWTHVCKAWYKTFALLQRGYLDPRPDHSLHRDVQQLLDSFLDFFTCTNTRSCFSESFKLLLRFIDILKSEETKAALAHVPLVYTHIVDAFASGQAKHLVHMFMEQSLPHFIDWATDEHVISSMAHVLAHTLHALEMERLRRHLTYQTTHRFRRLPNITRKIRVQTMAHNLTSKRYSHLRSSQWRAQRRYTRNRFIRTNANSFVPIVLDMEEEHYKKDNTNMVHDEPEENPSITPLRRDDDLVSSLGDKTDSFHIEPDWIHRLGKQDNEQEQQHGTLVGRQQDMDTCPPSHLVTIPTKSSTGNDPTYSQNLTSLVKPMDNNHKGLVEDISDLESLRIDDTHDSLEETTIADGCYNALTSTTMPSQSALHIFNETFEHVQGQVKRTAIDRLLKEDREYDSTHSKRSIARNTRAKKNHQRPTSWFPKSAAAAGCGDEYGHDTLKRLMTETSAHHQPRIFRRDREMNPKKRFDRSQALERRNEEKPSILSAFWDMLTTRQRVIFYILVGNIAIFLILVLFLTSYVVFLLWSKIVYK